MYVEADPAATGLAGYRGRAEVRSYANGGAGFDDGCGVAASLQERTWPRPTVSTSPWSGPGALLFEPLDYGVL